MIEKLINKKNTFYYDEENIPDENVIKEMVDLICKRAPSNQNRVMWEMHVLGPKNYKEKTILFQHGWCNDPLDPYDRRQPNFITAPFVILWIYRDENEEISGYADVALEAGMAAGQLMLLAREKGLSTSFTKCIRRKEEGDWKNYSDSISKNAWTWLSPIWKNKDDNEDAKLRISANPFFAMAIGYKDKMDYTFNFKESKKIETENGMELNLVYQDIYCSKPRPELETIRKYYW